MFFCLDENKNLVEALDKQGVLNALETAIRDGSLKNLVADSAFVNKLKCCVGGDTFQVAFIPQAKFNELAAVNQLKSNCLYFITDETTVDDLDETIANLNQELSDIKDGKTIVPKADDTKKINGIKIVRDTEGVLRIGATVIPVKKLLFSGKATYDNYYTVGTDIRGKNLEIKITQGADGTIGSVFATFVNDNGGMSVLDEAGFDANGNIVIGGTLIQVVEDGMKLQLYRFNSMAGKLTSHSAYIEVYEIIDGTTGVIANPEDDNTSGDVFG